MKPAAKAGTLLALALGGCTVGPDYRPPAAPAGADYTREGVEHTVLSAGAGIVTQRFDSDGKLTADWWRLFRSEPLRRLTERALRANPDIEAARATLREAGEARRAQAAAFFPVVQGNLAFTRYKTATSSTASPATLANGGLPPATFDFYSAEINANFMPDIFGLNRRSLEVAKAEEEAASFQLIAADLTVSGGVVTTAIAEAGLRSEIAATERLIAIQRQLTEMARRQQRIGADAGLDVVAQQTAEAALPPLRRALAETRDALAVLVGTLPEQALVETFRLEDLALPAEVPLSLPSALVAQRPDIRSAAALLHAATAAVGVAEADRLPQFSITANLGTAGLQPGQLFGPGYGFWTLGAGLAQTLFDAGTLRHKEREAVAAMDAAGAQYRATVLSAFQNVADLLYALREDAAALAAAARGEALAAHAFDIARAQYRLGAISTVALLSAEQGLLQAELAAVATKASRLTDTAALLQALGGGWWNTVGPVPVPG